MAASNSRISMLVTSCGRHDLLRTTLESFYAHTDIEPQEIVIYEDSGEPLPGWLNTNEWRGRNLRWVSDGTRRGQAYACARLIEEAQYPFVLWWEDDWLTQQGDFIGASKEILQTHPKVIQVSLRGNTGWHPLADPDEIDPRAQFKLAMPYWHGVWGGWAWNPGLRRKSECLGIQKRVSEHIGVGGLEHEKAISKELLDAGWRVADLNREIVAHIGQGRSRAIEALPAVPRILIAVPACFAFAYGKWESEESPLYSQATAYNGQPYGRDIHISRPVNDRIAAVRDTWAQDAKAYATVDVKFFYGQPAGGWPREPLPDEIFLHCPDDYEGLPQKTIAICGHAKEQGYDFLFKCDDDTYVWVDRLVRELLSSPCLDYGGWLNGKTCTGGPGYWLSRRAFSEVVRNPVGSHWAEDVTVAKIMGAAGIEPMMLERHRPGQGQHWYFPGAFAAEKLIGNEVTIHAVQPLTMRQIYGHKDKAKVLIGGEEFEVLAEPRDFWGWVKEGRYDKEWRLLKTFLKPEDTFIDVGAWVGSHALFASRIASSVHAAEPDPVAYKILLGNAAPVSNIKTYPIAIAGHNGRLKLGSAILGASVTRSCPAAYREQAAWDDAQSFTVECQALAKFCSAVPGPLFIKMDIEGGEEGVLGNLDFFEDIRPTLLLECHPFWWADPAKTWADIGKLSQLYAQVLDENMGPADLPAQPHRLLFIGRK